MFNVVGGEKEHLCWYLSASTTQASDLLKKTVKLKSHKDDFKYIYKYALMNWRYAWFTLQFF